TANSCHYQHLWHYRIASALSSASSRSRLAARRTIRPAPEAGLQMNGLQMNEAPNEDFLAGSLRQLASFAIPNLGSGIECTAAEADAERPLTCREIIGNLVPI